jgi:hypothetical protein
LSPTCDGCHGLHRTFLISDMGEPNLPHVVAPANARSSDEKHVSRLTCSQYGRGLASFPASTNPRVADQLRPQR